jgi:putative membrane protein
MSTRNSGIAILILATAAAAPALPASLSFPSEPQPAPVSDTLAPAPLLDSWTPGSATLVPLMAADTQAAPATQVDPPAAGTSQPTGKPLDDISFVKRATESGRKEVAAARNALPQLTRPELKHMAEMLVQDHTSANAKLSKIAEAKGWPLPAPQADAPPPSGTASSDFDDKWTAEMIAGHERSVAMYRAQAQAGEDQDLRKYARDTLPTIEHHLTELKKLQK